MELREHRRMPDDELLEVGEADGFAVETEIGVKQGVWLIEQLVVDGIEQAANEVLVLFGGHASPSPPLNGPSPQLFTCPRACYELGRKSHRNADFMGDLVPSRSLFPAFLSCF